ncbi:hypothetical protein MASR2M32_24160 [Sphaerotilus sulfidivorans]
MTVPITEAMQMIVSSAMAKRIDDSSSTLSRSQREPRPISRPAVEEEDEADMADRIMRTGTEDSVKMHKGRSGTGLSDLRQSAPEMESPASRPPQCRPEM